MSFTPKLHALCVDDEPDNLLVITYTLKYHHITCKAVPTGEEALGLLAVEHFDLALLDIQMPKMSGWDLVKHIRASEIPHIRNLLLIAVTAHAMRGDQDRILAAGFDGYISKPIDAISFLQTLQSITPINRALETTNA